MARVLDVARRVAQVDSTVLLTGESGVGKERVARFIHHESARTGGPFVAINCGAVPENLLESELFGHTRGSFTGATQDRVGLFEAANGGTLLLDEIGEVPAPMQVKLLRVLQERQIRRVGENKTRALNVRVLAATNRNLVDEIRAARFRQEAASRRVGRKIRSGFERMQCRQLPESANLNPATAVMNSSPLRDACHETRTRNSLPRRDF